ncbi:hypothetical protein CNMCM5793_008443 [Aspergillus hiratsukae]|uniref:Centrosomin N-terminal motif 1 domain-containing protein n=1 Tax=Aspergillus hiratsukae TaxID=1194566 RepID=A0A8H6UC84_9EURO|nr:hypothetical protein CNMCM5793_008443 [Aspergillus hiratsukae]KAF7171308.1 hypothetical protein CNMCM6106_005741 [Aspergillus hiratsukae]
MDSKPQRRSTISVQSTAPSSVRHSFDPSSSVPVPARRTAFLRHRSSDKSDPPIPAALARVKGTSTMNSPSRLNSETSWFNGPSPLSGTPRTTPRHHGSRPGTPEPASTPLVNPSSTLLQDLLREQRATRSSRGPPDDRDVYIPRTPERSQPQSQTQTQPQSQEDAGSERQRKITSALSAGLKQPQEMGIREMDQYISKINKQNFDLKLDIFHRARQMAVLEKRLERMQQLEEDVQRMRDLEEELQELRDVEEDNQRLRESNEQLRQEIDKRDQAVTEAVELICQLEARLEELEAGAPSSAPSTARPSSSDGPDAATPRNCVTPDIPERSSSKKGTVLVGNHHRVSSGSRSLTRAPSFLREEQQGTAALRSLFVASEHHSRSARSAMAKTESMNSMTETIEPESPRLSALSECSELMPYDTINEAPLFNKVDTPVDQEKAMGTSATTTPRPKFEVQASRHIRSSSWHQPQVELFATKSIPKQRDQAHSNGSKEAEDYTIKNSMFSSAPRQKLRLDDVFGGSKLPPTPDTMSTACASGTNRSNGSSARDKVQPYQQFSSPRKLDRPRSAGELTTRSSDHRDLERIDTALSDVTLPRLSTEEREPTPAIFPLNGIASRTNYVFDQASPKPSMRYFSDVDDVIYNPVGIEKVISKMEKNYYSPPLPITEKPTANMTSLSPPLTPQDWVEAAKPGPRPTKTRSSKTKTYTGLPPDPSKAAGARAPSQSAFLARRHSVDSTLRDPGVPAIPTLLLPPSDTTKQPVHQEREHRRRINLRPPFLGRLAQPRRLEPSPITDSEDSGDGAPSPVIRKARHIEAQKITKTVETVDVPQPAHGELCVSAPTYAAANTANSPSRTLPHSFTDSNFWSHSSTARPSTSAGKGHKRRSSLGIFGFGWIKGSSGSGSHHKKAGADSTASFQTTSKERPTSRWGPDSSNALPELSKTVGAYGAYQDLSASARHASQKPDDGDSTHRPRYIERRARRP